MQIHNHPSWSQASEASQSPDNRILGVGGCQRQPWGFSQPRVGGICKQVIREAGHHDS